MLQPGMLLAEKYEVEALVGEGTFGRVYRARDRRLGRYIAIKELRKEPGRMDSVTFADFAERFRREARVQAQFDHPNLVHVYELLEPEAEALYLITEFVAGPELGRDEMRGVTLKDYLARHGALPLEEALRILRGVLAGLAVVHRHPWAIVHRDIKPSNILLTRAGEAKVSDFGLAQVLDESMRSQRAKPHPGSLAYMSPEQARTVAYLTPASDLYSVGCVLFEALTGVVYRQAEHLGQGLRDLRPDVPEWLAEVLARALAEEPRQRFRRAEEFAAALAEPPPMTNIAEQGAGTAQRFGKYILEAQLGEGAFATVWRAQDTHSGRSVALKRLKGDWWADGTAWTRFVQALHATSALYHPHIALLHELGTVDGQPYLALRYVEGVPLDRLLRERGALPWEEAWSLVEQVAAALDYAQRRGLVHGDLKPANIIVSPSEGAVVTDFGLAQARAAALGAKAAMPSNTLPYRPPEMWHDEDKAGPPTAASDVYSLACVLVEMVSGQVLFSGKDAAAVRQRHLQEKPPLPAQWPPGVPAGLTQVLHKALAQSPEARYPSAGAFLAALRPPVTVPAQPSPEKSPPKEAEKKELRLTLARGVELELVYVPAGEFLMGSAEDDEMAQKDEKPQHVVYLDAYWIGKYPVTVAQFAAFVRATGYKTTAEQTGYEETWKKYAKGRDDHPVVCVSWFDACAFCEWAWGVTGHLVRLPTEAEWEKAARGTDGRRYPWGNQPPNGRCNFGKMVGSTKRVGRYSPQGDSPYGCADMAGNVWEWVADWYAEDYYAHSPRKNPAGPPSGEYRVLRGGAWDDYSVNVRAAYRSWFLPDDRSFDIGFRCAVSTSSL